MELFGIYWPERLFPSPLSANVRAADVTSRDQMKTVFEWARPRVVIHTAGIGSVDWAERNREQTYAVNVIGTQIAGHLATEYGASFIYISSNAVFDGNRPLYSENDPVCPINYYGQLKVEAEDWVKANLQEWAIVRPILMYGWPYPGERDNPVVWWIRSLRKGEDLKVVDNVYSKPLPAWSCAEAIWALIRQSRPGIFHVAGRDHLSLHDFALATAKVFQLEPNLITPVPDTYFAEIAPRPRDTSFATEKMENELGVPPVGVSEGLTRLKEIERCWSYAK
jgi:dTDP-4-dehydrorhamnose reductase